MKILAIYFGEVEYNLFILTLITKRKTYGKNKYGRKNVKGSQSRRSRDGKTKATELSGTKYVEKEPAAADYEKALEMVEEIKQAAENEPGVQKVLYKIGRFLVYVADFGLAALSYESPTSLSTPGIKRPPGYRETPRLRGEGYFTPDILTNLMDKLADAEKELQILKKEAKQ